MKDKSEMDTEERLAEELYDHRDDPGEWSDEAEEVEVRPASSGMVSFRLPRDELAALSTDATTAGLSVSEVIRLALKFRRMVGSSAGLPMIISLGGTPVTEADGPRITSDMSGLFSYPGWVGFNGSVEPTAPSNGQQQLF